mmetsp:Transcript_35144/g.91965  ORF Transcript_35144/g.91965 Transcript_35144/m.91965 type:complete len:264 (+) Transcript_35144:184-975(+)
MCQREGGRRCRPHRCRQHEWGRTTRGCLALERSPGKHPRWRSRRTRSSSGRRSRSTSAGCLTSNRKRTARTTPKTWQPSTLPARRTPRWPASSDRARCSRCSRATACLPSLWWPRRRSCGRGTRFAAKHRRRLETSRRTLRGTARGPPGGPLPFRRERHGPNFSRTAASSSWCTWTPANRTRATPPSCGSSLRPNRTGPSGGPRHSSSDRNPSPRARRPTAAPRSCLPSGPGWCTRSCSGPRWWTARSSSRRCGRGSRRSRGW